jgi:hypothetical protein
MEKPSVYEMTLEVFFLYQTEHLKVYVKGHSLEPAKYIHICFA